MIDAGEAMAFFDALERGAGWEVCRRWCKDDAGFACQADALAEVTRLSDYAAWMQALYERIPDGRYDLKAAGAAEDGTHYMVFAVFRGTLTGADGASRALAQDYVYVMRYEEGSVAHLTKIWNDRFGK